MPKSKAGRPTSYRPVFAEQAKQLSTLGMTDREIAGFLKVAVSTLYLWKHEHPEFMEAFLDGRAKTDDRVQASLYHKAIGYTFDSEKVFQFQGEIIRAKTVEHVPPDTTACMFWLKNRKSSEWREKQELEHSGSVTLEQLVMASYEKESKE